MNVLRAETAQDVGCSQEHSRYQVIALGRAHNLSECDIQGRTLLLTCRGGCKTKAQFSVLCGDIPT